jgi:hypothetical protein
MMEATCEHGTTPSCGAYMKRRAHAHETTFAREREAAVAMAAEEKNLTLRRH